MKRTKTWLLGLLAAVLLSGAAVPSWAYTLTLFNDTGMNIYPKVYSVTEGKSKALAPGETWKVSNDDWHNKGLCWTRVDIEWDALQGGCTSSPFTISLMKCGDVSMSIEYNYKDKCKFFYTSY